jgi:hypothetical protein
MAKYEAAVLINWEIRKIRDVSSCKMAKFEASVLFNWQTGKI